MIKFEEYTDYGKDIIKKVVKICQGLSVEQAETLCAFFDEFQYQDIIMYNLCNIKLGRKIGCDFFYEYVAAADKS